MEHSEKSASQNHAQSTVGLTTPSAKAVGHTALPWRVGSWHGDSIWILRDTDVIATVENIGDSSYEGETQATARFIVRACNSHYQLLSALKSYVCMMDIFQKAADQIMWNNMPACFLDFDKQAKAAIAEAEAGQ